LSTALLLNGIYMHMKFQVSSMNTFWVMLHTKFKNEWKGNNSKSMKLIYGSCAWLFSSMRFIYLWSFMLMPCIILKLSSWTKFKYENEQRAITPKVWNFELWFLCTALLLDEIYLPMKFHGDAFNSFKVMLRTKKGRTDGQTDRQTDESITICHPSGA